MTVGQWLQDIDPADRLDYELLLCDALGLGRAQVMAFPERTIPADKVAALANQRQCLAQGMPLAYVLNRQEFWGLNLYVDTHVLIPRPDTELLVELATHLAPSAATVLDLGTGSGAIALAIASERPDLALTGADISSDALQVARRNGAALALDVHWCASDWFAQLPGCWHMLIANPPYIAANDPHLPHLRHEPAGALVAGPQGLDDLTQIISQAPQHLYRQGYCLVEHGYDQGPAVRALFSAAGFAQIQTHRDLARHERVTLGQWMPAHG